MMSSRGSPEPHSSQYILTPSFITNGMEVSGDVTHVWKYDGLTQMYVTNAFALYIIRHAMPNQDTLYQVADRIATITLNRPDKLNAWTAIMEREVHSGVEEAERDENVRVIVLTGAGRAFCAGADMSLLRAVAEKGLDAARTAQAAQKTEKKSDGVRGDFQHRYSYFPALTKPVIAAVNGPVVGLGLVIALYCDIRLASDAARFGTAFAQRGLIAEYGMAWMLPRLVGHANALDLLFSARMIDAAEALRMGLVNQVFPRETFLENAQSEE